MTKMRAAILGSGNIGCDLLVKVLRSPTLCCSAFIGRNAASEGLAWARSLNVAVSADGITYLQKNADSFDIVFDATSASAHRLHAPILQRLGKFVVDLTPAKVGQMCVPAVNIAACLQSRNVNMVTCGGQAAIPIAHAISQVHPRAPYMEVISSIASRSAGPATRLNLDEYIQTTELGVLHYSGAQRCKAILNLNPAVPCVNMQTTLLAKVVEPDLARLQPILTALVTKMRTYVPGYELLVGPLVDHGRIVVTVRVKGLGDFLPEYAGNLDIINCAALATAESFALACQQHLPLRERPPTPCNAY
jgi:acetaldehyde dehydrogenase (acetylating)